MRMSLSRLPAAALLLTLLAGTAMLAPSAPAHAQSARTPPSKPVAKPAWHDLGERQQRALEPLAGIWDELTEQHKRKWLLIVRDHAEMSASDQEVLRSRMNEWARLSSRQRDQARLNFADAKRLPADERKAKWEAYQALSEEERSRLAASARPVTPPGAAPAIRPVPAQKLAPLPASRPDAQHLPRIELAPPLSTAATRPAAAAPVPAAPPVAAEAQVPPPTATAPPPAPQPEAAAAPAAGRPAEQPSSAP